MKILILGANGYLGGYIRKELNKDNNYELICIDKEDADVNNATEINKIISKIKPSMVVNLVALCGAQPSIKDPYNFYNTNAFSILNILEACKKNNVNKFLFTSSLTVFGKSNVAVDENSKFNPRHPYAASKVCAEIMIENYVKNYEFSSLIMRPTLVVGENSKELHAIGDFISIIKKMEDIEIYGEGKHIRDFIHPEDVALATVLCINFLLKQNNRYFDTFNFSNNEPIGIGNLARKVIDTIGYGNIKYAETTDQTFSLFTSISKSQNILKWNPKITLEEIINRLK
jgi:nucleoside-diphosphate-sugar epimerase